MGEPAKLQVPGPGRSTAEAAFNARKKEIAECNDRAQREAAKQRAVREKAAAARRRALDLS